jgi:hypothetical protein
VRPRGWRHAFPLIGQTQVRPGQNVPWMTSTVSVSNDTHWLAISMCLDLQSWHSSSALITEMSIKTTAISIESARAASRLPQCLSGTFHTLSKGRLPEGEGANQSASLTAMRLTANQSASLTAMRLTAHSESVLPGSASSWGCILYLHTKIIKTIRSDVEGWRAMIGEAKPIKS